MEDFGKTFGENKGGSDNWCTPVNAIVPLLKYLPKGSNILCPFDTGDSNYVKVLSEEHNVKYSHIDFGFDFFQLGKPDGVDYIISNPPFTKKTEILEQLYDWDIPFAMLLNCNGIFDHKVRVGLAKSKGVELMYMTPRVKFLDPVTHEAKISPSHQSCYWCYKLLPEKLIFEDIV